MTTDSIWACPVRRSFQTYQMAQLSNMVCVLDANADDSTKRKLRAVLDLQLKYVLFR